MPATATARLSLEAIYERHCADNRASTPHLPRLRALASDLRVRLAVEFGVKHGASSAALLMGTEKVIGYDIARSPLCEELQEAAGERWDYRIEDSRSAHPVACDLLFVDSAHTYGQARAELERWADAVAVYLVAHDIMTFGTVGAAGETGRWMWQQRQPCEEVPEWAWGVRLAFDELMVRDPSWRIAAVYPESHGLLVLERSR